MFVPPLFVNWLGILSRAVASRPWTAPARGRGFANAKGRAGMKPGGPIDAFFG